MSNLPKNHMLPRFPINKISIQEAYDDMLSNSCAALVVRGEDVIGIQYGMDPEYEQYIQVSANDHKPVGSHTGLIFNQVIGTIIPDEWVAVFQLDEKDNAKAVVFVNDQGLRIEITATGDIFTFIKNIRCAHYGSNVPTRIASIGEANAAS